jgi:tetratricopeptide (TPR) repeat protein
MSKRNNPSSRQQPLLHPARQGLASQRTQMLEQAASAMRMQRFAEAEQLAAEILKASRTDAAAISILGHALLAQDRPSEAIPHLERAVRRNADPALETLLGAAFGAAGRGGEAIDQLRRAAARRPAYPPAFQELANQLAKAERYQDAIATIQEALALLPGVIELELVLARLHLLRNERAEARAILARVHDAAPVRTDVAIELARVMMRDGDYAAAAEVYRRALGRNPADVLTRAELATCLLEQGEREAGEAALRRVMQGQPQLLGRAAYALAVSSHGRFFFRPSALRTFLQE